MRCSDGLLSRRLLPFPRSSSLPLLTGLGERRRLRSGLALRLLSLPFLFSLDLETDLSLDASLLPLFPPLGFGDGDLVLERERELDGEASFLERFVDGDLEGDLEET